MEEIIGLLIIVAISIFQGVSKKLEKSGKQQGPESPVGPKAHCPSETGSDDSPFDIKKWIDEAVKEAEVEMGMNREPEEDLSASVEEAASVRPVTMAKSVVARKPPIMNIEEEKTNKEKIDPKKLIVYSEIMNPKYK